MGQGFYSVEKHTRGVTYRASVTNRYIASLAGLSTDEERESIWFLPGASRIPELWGLGLHTYFSSVPGNGDVIYQV